MKIHTLDEYDDISRVAKAIVVDELRKKSDMLLCAATGNSPTKTYELLGEEYKKQPKIFSQFRVVKLDEWGDIPMDHPKTCESYLQSHLIEPLHISESRYISFLSDPEDPYAECIRIQEALEEVGHIDLCILGLGMNGHIALNEPADFLQPYSHVAKLSEMSLNHPMASGMRKKPSYGLTLGMADILKARRIIMLISGSNKETITKKFLKGEISTSLPASFLWLHPDVTCLVDNEALSD